MPGGLSLILGRAWPQGQSWFRCAELESLVMTRPQTIASLQRGLQVLAAIQRFSALSFSEVREATGLPKATLSRLLQTLEASGWVRRQGPRGRYVCEPDPALDPVRREQLAHWARLAQPVFTRLQSVVPWPIDLGVRDGGGMLIIDAPEDAAMGLSANYRRLGFRPPMLRSSLGLCHLAFCPEAERTDLLERLRRSPDALDQAVLHSGKLPQRLKDIRAQGYAVRDISVLPARSTERYGALAVPVRSGERLHGGLSCSWLLQIASLEQVVGSCLPAMREAAHALARRLEA